MSPKCTVVAHVCSIEYKKMHSMNNIKFTDLLTLFMRFAQPIKFSFRMSAVT